MNNLVQCVRFTWWVAAVPDTFEMEPLERWVQLAILDQLRYAIPEERIGETTDIWGGWTCLAEGGARGAQQDREHGARECGIMVQDRGRRVGSESTHWCTGYGGSTSSLK